MIKGSHGIPKVSVLRANAAGGNKWDPATLTWYDPALGGINSSGGVANPHSKTSSGEPYDPTKDTCAAPPQYAFGTEITFQYLGTEVVCRVNDRGGAIRGNHFDLSRHAAETLGIINQGRVTGYFQVGRASGAPPAATSPGDSSGGGDSGLSGLDALSILKDILTLDLSDLALRLALASLGIVKDITLGIGDFVVIPWWHWNQRAVDYYLNTELFSKDENRWQTMPWTAAFWGLGYWLFFTDPDSKGLAPAPVRKSRMARHVRGLQALPARRELIKPKDVRARTPKTPKPVPSRATVIQTGTMQVTRNIPVKVSGDNVRNGEPSRIPIGRGNARETAQFAERLPKNDPRRIAWKNSQNAKPDAADRAGSHSLSNGGSPTRESQGSNGNQNG